MLLAKSQILSTKAGKPYGSLTFSDADGEVAARLWDRAEELLEPLSVGQAVRVSGRVDSYGGRMQIIVNDLKPEPKADTSQFMQKSPVDPDELGQRLDKLLRSVKDRRLKRLLKAFFNDKQFRHDFDRAPAAKGAHHAYVHGLLEHTVCVGELALDLAGRYTELSRDLLITGALLHDIGKVKEFTLGPPIDYTDQGRLIGHLVIGVQDLDARLAKMRSFPPELADQIRHLILSHHGQYEFGSPKKPKTPEALALHFVDDVDAKMAMLRQVASQSQNGDSNWSAYNRLLERFLYVGPRMPQAGDAPASPEPPEPTEERNSREQPPGLFGN